MLLSSTSSSGRAACLAMSYTESTVLLDPAVAHGVRRRHAPETRRSRPHVHFLPLGPRFPAWCGAAADQAGGAMRSEIKIRAADQARAHGVTHRGPRRLRNTPRPCPKTTRHGRHESERAPNLPHNRHGMLRLQAEQEAGQGESAREVAAHGGVRPREPQHAVGSAPCPQKGTAMSAWSVHTGATTRGFTAGASRFCIHVLCMCHGAGCRCGRGISVPAPARARSYCA